MQRNKYCKCFLLCCNLERKVFVSCDTVWCGYWCEPWHNLVWVVTQISVAQLGTDTWMPLECQCQLPTLWVFTFDRVVFRQTCVSRCYWQYFMQPWPRVPSCQQPKHLLSTATIFTASSHNIYYQQLQNLLSLDTTFTTSSYKIYCLQSQHLLSAVTTFSPSSEVPIGSRGTKRNEKVQILIWPTSDFKQWILFALVRISYQITMCNSTWRTCILFPRHDTISCASGALHIFKCSRIIF